MWLGGERSGTSMYIMLIKNISGIKNSSFGETSSKLVAQGDFPSKFEAPIARKMCWYIIMHK